jgi:hypothetical protein
MTQTRAARLGLSDRRATQPGSTGEYGYEGKLMEQLSDADLIDRSRQDSGCFVMISP